MIALPADRAEYRPRIAGPVSGGILNPSMAAEELVEQQGLKRSENGSVSTLVPTQRATPYLQQLSQVGSGRA